MNLLKVLSEISTMECRRPVNEVRMRRQENQTIVNTISMNNVRTNTNKTTLHALLAIS